MLKLFPYVSEDLKLQAISADSVRLEREDQDTRHSQGLFLSIWKDGMVCVHGEKNLRYVLKAYIFHWSFKYYSREISSVPFTSEGEP